MEKITIEDIKKVLNDNIEKAKDLLNDDVKMESFLQNIENKLKEIPKVGDKLSDIPVLISLVRSYIKKDYTEIPTNSLLMVVAALIYFLSPVDLIPDAIPIIGYIDDVAVVGFVLNSIEEDLNNYKNWQRQTGRR